MSDFGVYGFLSFIRIISGDCTEQKQAVNVSATLCRDTGSNKCLEMPGYLCQNVGVKAAMPLLPEVQWFIMKVWGHAGVSAVCFATSSPL